MVSHRRSDIESRARVRLNFGGGSRSRRVVHVHLQKCFFGWCCIFASVGLISSVCEVIICWYDSVKLLQQFLLQLGRYFQGWWRFCANIIILKLNINFLSFHTNIKLRTLSGESRAWWARAFSTIFFDHCPSMWIIL